MLKIGPLFVFVFLKSSFSLQKEEEKSNQKKDPKVVLKIGPLCCATYVGPVFNTTLDQFLTTFLCFRAETPILLCFRQTCKLWRNTKKTLFVSTSVLFALVKMSCFSAFSCFLQYHFCWEMFLIGSQKSKESKRPEQQKQTTTTTTTTRKQYAKQKQI